MKKKITLTEDQLMEAAKQAVENLNKIHELTPMLTVFAGIISIEIRRVLFDNTSNSDVKEFTIKE